MGRKAFIHPILKSWNWLLSLLLAFLSLVATAPQHWPPRQTLLLQGSRVVYDWSMTNINIP